MHHCEATELAEMEEAVAGGRWMSASNRQATLKCAHHRNWRSPTWMAMQPGSIVQENLLHVKVAIKSEVAIKSSEHQVKPKGMLCTCEDW